MESPRTDWKIPTYERAHQPTKDQPHRMVTISTEEAYPVFSIAVTPDEPRLPGKWLDQVDLAIPAKTFERWSKVMADYYAVQREMRELAQSAMLEPTDGRPDPG